MNELGHIAILDHFRKWAAEQPDGIAVRYGDDTLTFRKLDQISDKVADDLIGTDPSRPFIGLSATKNLSAIIGLLAIIKSGRAYLPLEPSYPAARIRQMLSDSGVETVICGPDEDQYFTSAGLRIVTATSDRDEHANIQSLSLNAAPELIALLYTSGSTGFPKGVCVTHDGVHNLIEHQLQHTTARPGSQNLLFSQLTFDASLHEIGLSLASGGTLHIIDDSIRLDSVRLLKYIDEWSINRISVPYVTLQYLTKTAQAAGRYLPSLNEIITGGELLKITPPIRDFFRERPDCTLVNVYGPTETSILVTTLRLKGDASQWLDIPTIGSPIENTDIFILNDELHEVSEGEVGEICIAGVCVSKGYLNQEQLTAARYVNWKDNDGRAYRIYRSGDLGRRRPDGQIEFHGRVDNQIKIRGNRVELSEIEVRITELSQVEQGVVVMREDTPGVKRLVAYLVANGHTKPDATIIREHLRRQLPDYMIPAAFVWMEQLPRTHSDKIDIAALPAPNTRRSEADITYRRPSTAVEQVVTRLWADLLLLDKIGIDDNFFEWGGNSLLAQAAVANLQQQHAIEIPVTSIYQYPTAAKLAAFIQGEAPSIPLPRTRSSRRHPTHDRGVAVIGMTGRFPGARSIKELWDVLVSGKETITFFAENDLDESIPQEMRDDPQYVRARGIIDQAEWFDEAIFGITPALAKLMDPQQRLFLELCRDVLESAGYLASRSDHVIGVYAGQGSNTYYLNNVQHHPEEITKVGQLHVTLANDKDYLAARIAYHLDLKGPAVSVNTACSTSLVAVTQAVEAIRNGHCNLAIAGGISVTVPINSGQRHEEGAMFSTDGHTRTFDASATGTVFSDGGGVVLLKDLEAAMADGDTIYAVIRGVGLSNDGGGKGSFMAPSAAGQAAAIQMALTDAGFVPESLGYIEAHGTATPLGDPIEIEGLKLAFGPVTTNQFCRIGSIKSNMGHLTHAAGIAGLIKVVLSLHHRMIPPTINFTRQSQHINFTKSPFTVNDSLYTWDSGRPFRAGVSSFGIGGTNAHVVLEAYNARAPRKTRDRVEATPLLINWSAKTENSGRSYANRLVDFLWENPKIPLDALAYTLHTTREDLDYRFAVVATDRGQLLEKLKSGRWLHHRIREKAGSVAFLFPGQGAQYPRMGATLYEHEPVYREAIDHCADILLKEMGEDIRTIIFPDNCSSLTLGDTYYTQPALFMTAFATSKLWMSWGIEPAAYLGHSVGEFVAAHLAGVFTLEDALKLIVSRARLCGSVASGSMLSVRASLEKIATMLPSDLAVAAHNAPDLCVVSGPDDAIQSFSNVLASQEIPCKRLHTSHAFHSEMMRPIVDSFRSAVAEVPLNIPHKPIVSTVTGSWLTDQQATDPSYWANHMLATVRFSDAVMFLEQALSPIYLEAGPGQSTTMLVKQHGAEVGQRAIATLYNVEENEYQTLYRALAGLWMHGQSPKWEKVYHDKLPAVLQGLPTYAYDRKYHWIGARKPEYAQTTPEPADLSSNITTDTTMRKTLLINKVKEILSSASGIDINGAPTHASFFEIGLDSLLLTQVAQSMKKSFGLPITFRMLNEQCYNLDLLGDYLDSHLPHDAFQPDANASIAPPSMHQAPDASGVKTASATGLQPGDAINLITQQIALLSQQIALLQGARTLPTQPMQPSAAGSPAAASDQDKEAPMTAEEIAELKRPFGATVKIDRTASALEESKSRYLADFIDRYTAKTAKSKAYTQEHRSHMADPRVVSGFRPATKEMIYAIVTNRSKGSRVWDIDGNEYIDALNGFGSSMLGYQPQHITEALHQQIEEGYEIGPQHEKAGDVCRLICELTRTERAALCNTGSEAVLGAMRIARTITGRSTIVAFSNSYHGIIDEVIVRGTKHLKSFPAAPGILPEAVQNMLILDYGNPESLRIIRERAGELAAILVEPVQSRRPEFQPIEFVRELRRITAESGTALIFDEVITGFRMHLHGIQHLWGIQADLVTYGKVVASGMSVGVIAGKRHFMDALDGGFWSYGDSSAPETGVTYFAGTFVRHPLALAAAKASLEYLKAAGPQLQEQLTARTAYLADELNKICRKYHTPMYVAQFGSLWKVKYHQEFPFSELLFAAMRLRGIHILDGFPCFLTTAHTDSDIAEIIRAFEESVHELIIEGFISTTEETIPPVPNAKLGRDINGEPAWFVEDKTSPGRFLQVVCP